MFGISFIFDWINIVFFVLGILIGFCFFSKKIIEDGKEKGDEVWKIYLKVILTSLLTGVIISLMFSIGRK